MQLYGQTQFFTGEVVAMPGKYTKTYSPTDAVDSVRKHVVRVHAAQAHVPAVQVPHGKRSSQQ
jgi:hypothetical protein